MSELPYRQNVAIVVVNREGLILACRRSDAYQAWQLPQGGIEAGEEPEEAMWRELEEEIGTTDVKVIGRLKKPIRYDWPTQLHRRGFSGQEQTYFLVRLKKKAAIDIFAHEKPEFDKTEWLHVEDFLERIEGFKAAAYEKALKKLRKKYPEYFAS